MGFGKLGEREPQFLKGIPIVSRTLHRDKGLRLVSGEQELSNRLLLRGLISRFLGRKFVNVSANAVKTCQLVRLESPMAVNKFQPTIVANHADSVNKPHLLNGICQAL